MPFRSFIERFYAKKPARWQVTYSATITAQKAYAGWLILPLPQRKTSHQELEGEITFSAPPTFQGTEYVHGNNFAAWQVNLAPGGQFTATANMTIKKTPIAASINHELIVDFYMNSPQRYYRQYTTSNAYIQGGDPRVQEIATKLREGSHSIAELVARANEYVIKTLKYGNPISGLYTANDALTKDAVDCGGYDTLLISILNALGIPARVVAGFWLTPGATEATKAMHAWVAISLPDGTWFPLDPSVEQLRRLGRSKKIGSLGALGSDRLVLSTGCDFSVEISGQKIQVDILQNPILYPSEPETKTTASITATRL